MKALYERLGKFYNECKNAIEGSDTISSRSVSNFTEYIANIFSNKKVPLDILQRLFGRTPKGEDSGDKKDGSAAKPSGDKNKEKLDKITDRDLVNLIEKRKNIFTSLTTTNKEGNTKNYEFSWLVDAVYGSNNKNNIKAALGNLKDENKESFKKWYDSFRNTKGPDKFNTGWTP
jgi:hypothetical protein